MSVAAVAASALGQLRRSLAPCGASGVAARNEERIAPWRRGNGAPAGTAAVTGGREQFEART